PTRRSSDLSFGWLGAETYPGQKGNRHLAAVSERFPEITGWPAGIPSFRSSIAQEAQTTEGRPVMPCAPLWPGRRQQRLWMGLEHTTWRDVSVPTRNRAIDARYRCKYQLPV